MSIIVKLYIFFIIFKLRCQNFLSFGCFVELILKFDWFLIEQWQKSYAKLEGKRDALRQGVQILKDQIDRLQSENAELHKGSVFFNF